METELTKSIKRCIRGYKPKLPTKLRTVRWAEEVWTPTGIVDSIRFEDYYASEKHLCLIIDHEQFSEAYVNRIRHPLGICFRDNTTDKNETKCHGCVNHQHKYEIGMMITCYEVKISLSDFHSKNGHNFHGNENYYVVPAKLAPKIKELVPEDIGIITYKKTEKSEGLRMYKPSGWRDIEEKVKTMLLYNALKKWCDGASFSEEKNNG